MSYDVKLQTLQHSAKRPTSVPNTTASFYDGGKHLNQCPHTVLAITPEMEPKPCIILRMSLQDAAVHCH